MSNALVKVSNGLLEPELWHVPETYMFVPETYMCVPETYMCVPETYMCVPETYMCVPEAYMCVDASLLNLNNFGRRAYDLDTTWIRHG